MSSQRRLLSFFSTLVITTMLFSGLSLPAASAQGPDGVERQLNAQTGKVSFISAEGGQALPAADVFGDALPAQDPAMALARRFGPDFGLKDPQQDLQQLSSDRAKNGRLTVRYQQRYQGIPVMGGELIVNTNDNGDLYSMNGEVSPALSLSTRPTVDPVAARQTARKAMAKWYQKSPRDFLVSAPELWIYDESLVQPSSRPAELVWRMEVKPKDASTPVRELVLVNAQRGSISLHFNQVDTAWQERIGHEEPQQTLPLIAPSTVKYEDLIVDEARNRLYGADKAGNKVDVISMDDLSVISSFSLTSGAAPVSLELSPDGNELAVAQSGSGFVKFIALTGSTMTETAFPLTGSGSKATEVIYGREGVLYALSNNGIHVIDMTITPHIEDSDQYLATQDICKVEKFGDISSDQNTLYFVTGCSGSAEGSLVKADISAGLAKPVLLREQHLYQTAYMTGFRMNLIDDETLLITTGSVYNTSDLTPRGKNFLALSPAINLPGKNFYVTSYNRADALADLLYFYDNETSHRLSSWNTGVIGTPGAIATTGAGNVIFVSSTGGMTKISVGDTPPGTPVTLPTSRHQYRDFAIDLPRNLAYGTDVSGRIDVIDLGTAHIINSYLLPSGADPMGIDLNSDGSELAVALHGLEKILFINPEDGTTIARVTTQLADNSSYKNLPFDVIYGRPGRLYSNGNPGSGSDYIHVIDTSTHTWIGKSLNTIDTDTEFVLNQNRTYLYANHTDNLYIYDVQTDAVAELHRGPLGYAFAHHFTINPDGSKIFTSNGPVWDSTLQSKLGTLEGAPGLLIKYVPNKNILILRTGTNHEILKFISAVDYHLLRTYTPTPTGRIHEMEVTPDGSKLILNIGNEIRILNLDLTSFSALSGSNQMAALQTQFSQSLRATVKNYLDLPVEGVTIRFTAPFSGPGAVFEGTGTNTTTAATDSNGIATATLSANDVPGAYMVMATVEGLASSVNYQLTNIDATIPTSITIMNGSNQSAALQTPFSKPFKVWIKNALRQPLSGKIVTFTAPASKASGAFADTHTRISTVVTDSNGIATAAAFTANNLRGGYLVKATVAGLGTPAKFQLFNGILTVKTYTAKNGIALPGTFLCNQSKSNCTNGADPHANAAHRYAIGTSRLFANQYGRDSIDNRGMAVISTVHFNSGYDNAFWNGQQMVYGDTYGFPRADDVVAHELTHGVTQYESNLFYYYQSGAINESFSDLWGEYYDQTNGQGYDGLSAKWLIGEDVSGLGIIRNMSNPPLYGDPDKISSLNYYEGKADNGGVHSNSGVNNKAAYLIVDGGTFNGRTVTALGWTKTAAIYYEVNSNLLSSGADYSDLYYAVQKACSNLVGQKGITAADCVEVKDALDAVEMNGQPLANFNTDTPLCATGSLPNIVFADDLENGTANWTFMNGAYPRWQIDSLYGGFAQSGKHSLYADDNPGKATDATARLAALTVPQNAFLHFAHAYGFESGYKGGPAYHYFDGGVLEYTANGGASWVDAGPLINFNGYQSKVSGAGNPLSGRSGFVGSSHGYISTRLKLTPLAGKKVSFRWRIGLDQSVYDWGWWVDNVKVYTCIPN
jgi:Zn-dependent metalloprotease